SGLPNAWIIANGILLDGTPGDTAGITTFNAAIQAAVSALADPKIVYDNTLNTYYNASAGGGLHPNPTGSGLVGAHAPAAVNKSVPISSGGPVGVVMSVSGGRFVVG